MKIIHGGSLDDIVRLYGIERDKIRDFSGNINPLGAPESAKQAIIKGINSISTLPDIKYLELRKKISCYTGVDHEKILVGNGSTELISLCIKTFLGGKALVVSPAYSEYEREIKNAGGKAVLFPLTEELGFKLDTEKLFKTLDETFSLVVICNPNNPTGQALKRDEIESVLKHCKKHGIFVMVDETYAEFALDSDNVSSASLVGLYDNLFVIRGTSKFFAVPGLRLGYAMCGSNEVLEKIYAKKEHWTVNSLSNLAGIALFSDKEFIKKTKQYIFAEREKMLSELSKISSIKCFNSSSNFILFKLVDTSVTSSQIFAELVQHGMVVRDASSFPFLNDRFVRVCILGEEDNAELVVRLKGILG